MAVGAWTFIKHFKGQLGKGGINFGTGNWRMILCTSAGLFSAAYAHSTYGSIAGEVAAANNYSAGGGSRGLLTQSWASAGSAGNWKFSFSPARVWTAGSGTSAGGIKNVKFAVIYGSAGGHLVCFSQLSTSPFTITTNNTLTITASGSGVFSLT